jgi:hypothetical protein
MKEASGTGTAIGGLSNSGTVIGHWQWGRLLLCRVDRAGPSRRGAGGSRRWHGVTPHEVLINHG